MTLRSSEKQKISFYVNQTGYEKLRVIADRDDRSASSVINLAILGLVEKYEAENGKIKLTKSKKKGGS